jgi:hypothetical protein
MRPNIPSLAIFQSKAGESVGKNLHDIVLGVCYPNRSCLCKEKVRSLVVFPIW